MTLVFFNNVPLEPLQGPENATSEVKAGISNGPARGTPFRFLSQFQYGIHFNLLI
jgi:hypothetical protein